MSEWPPRLSAADEKGWFRFQRLYDVARSVLRTPDDVRRLVLRGRGGRRPRRRRLARDPGGPERLRRQVRRGHRVHGPGPGRGAGRLRGHGGRDGRGHRGEPHPAPARRPDARQAGRPVRRPGRRGLRPLERRAPGQHRRLRAGVPDRGAGRADAGAARRRAARPRARPGLPRRPAREPARARRSGPPRTPTCWPGSSTPASRWRCARSPTWPSGSTATSRRSPCPPCWRPARRWRSVRTTPCSSARSWPAQYATMRAAHSLSDGQLAELARMSVRASAAPDDVKARLMGGIDDWLEG